MSVVLPAPEGPDTMNKVPSAWKLLDICHPERSEGPVWGGWRDVVGFRTAPPTPIPRYARNDIAAGLTRHSAPARGSVRPRFSILQRGFAALPSATSIPWC